MTKLTTLQLARLNEVSVAAKEYRSARVNLEAELRLRLRLELEEQLSTLRNRRDRAAFHAMQAGIPKSRIGVDGLGTKNPQSATDAIEAGRKELGGTLDDVGARDALLAAAAEAATPTEPLYLHPRSGQPICSNRPFALGDQPGTFTFTAGVTMEGATAAMETATYRINDAGHVSAVTPGAEVSDMTALLKSGTPVGAALRKAAAEFMANAAN